MLTPLELQLTRDALAALGADSSEDPPSIERLDVVGSANGLASRFAVAPIALACVSAALLAARSLQHERGGPLAAIRVDRGHVAAAVRSERSFSRAGASSGSGFAPLSRFWPAADGWVRTHANYPWHRVALLDALGTSDHVDAVSAAIAGRAAVAIEDAVFAAGGVAAAVRTREQWSAHPQGAAVAREPLIDRAVSDGAARRTRDAGTLPASGFRVLDLTRVIAGPVCTRFLAALGADVLRVDPPQHPDMAPGTTADTLLGKRSTLVDLRVDGGPALIHELLDRADVVVCGYRPGALEHFGLDAETLTERHPGLVVTYLAAWGHTGPWHSRRGFDSVVQAPTGIAGGEAHGDEPGALPCQLLDHGTGYLAAAATLDALRRQLAEGGTHVCRVSLARTAKWLTATQADGGADGSERAVDDTRWLTTMPSVEGPATVVTPPGIVGDRPLQWPAPLTGYGRDPSDWADTF